MQVPKLSPREKALNSGHRHKHTRPISLFCLAVLAMLFTAGFVPAQNKVLKLDGHGSYVELPPNIFKELTQATVEVWVKWESFRTYSRVFEFGAGWQSMSLINHDKTSDLRFNLYPQRSQTDPLLRYNIRAANLLRTNEWIHLAAVSGPAGMKLYANGVLVGKHTNAASFADIEVFQTNYLGRGLVRNPTDQDFRGEIDELRVWDHRRTTAQIRENMFKRLSGTESGLTHLWNFDDGTANDASSKAHHGKLVGNAEIVNDEIGSTPEVAAAPAVTPSQPAVPSAKAPVVNVAANTAPTGAGAATWWIAGTLSVIVGLLAWLVMMLRRSGLGSSKLLPATTAAGLPATSHAASASATSLVQEDVKERALAELTSFAKQSLVQGLYSQRVALLETQQKAQQELAELESRLVALHLPDRIQAYEKRIAELEKQLETRNDELAELTHATLQVLRQKLEEEKLKEEKTSRLN